MNRMVVNIFFQVEHGLTVVVLAKAYNLRLPWTNLNFLYLIKQINIKSNWCLCFMIRLRVWESCLIISIDFNKLMNELYLKS